MVRAALQRWQRWPSRMVRAALQRWQRWPSRMVRAPLLRWQRWPSRMVRAALLRWVGEVGGGAPAPGAVPGAGGVPPTPRNSEPQNPLDTLVN